MIRVKWQTLVLLHSLAVWSHGFNPPSQWNKWNPFPSRLPFYFVPGMMQSCEGGDLSSFMRDILWLISTFWGVGGFFACDVLETLWGTSLFSETQEGLKELMRDLVNNSCPSITSHFSFAWPVTFKVKFKKGLFSSGFTSVTSDWKPLHPAACTTG